MRFASIEKRPGKGYCVGDEGEGGMVLIGRLTVVAAAAFALWGCTTAEQQTAMMEAERKSWLDLQTRNCRDYGFKEGTDAFATCMQTGINARREASVQASASPQGAFPPPPRPTMNQPILIQPPPQPVHPVRCTSSSVGGSVYTNCY